MINMPKPPRSCFPLVGKDGAFPQYVVESLCVMATERAMGRIRNSKMMKLVSSNARCGCDPMQDADLIRCAVLEGIGKHGGINLLRAFHIGSACLSVAGAPPNCSSGNKWLKVLERYMENVNNIFSLLVK